MQAGTPSADDDPYAALGLRVGSFLLFPTLTQSLGSTSNAEFTENGEASVFSLTDGRLRLQSDWALHQLTAEIGGSYQNFFSDEAENLRNFDAGVEVRFDHSGDVTTRFGLDYDLTTESAESDNLSVPPPLFVTERPDLHQFSGFGEIQKQAGRVNARLRGTITHASYDDAELSNGSSLSQEDRNNTLFELNGRVGYELSPAFQPFADATIGMREYARAIDRNGNTRDSMLYALRGGVAFDRGDKLTGEVSVGYSNETFDDSAIADLSGLTFDANINWSPQRLTTFTATAQTEFTGSTNANESGSITYAGTLGVVHDLRPNLSLSANVLASMRQYEGSNREDQLWQAQLGAEWRLNRTAAITATLGHEVLDSTDVNSSYEATTATIGLRLQR